MQLESGRVLGEFEIVQAIGAGGMGEVYRARDSRLDRDVALKVLPAEVAGDEERLARFRREAKLLASLTHTNIAAVYGFEEINGMSFLVMELVEGEELADRISRGPMPADEASAIALQVIRGLQAAHEKGIVHRDLKPANIKVSADNEVKILDFGLARAFMGDASGSGELSESPTITAATQQGVILGTAAYMSPEQARGQQVDHRSDIWSFGVVLYQMLTGTAPFTGDTVTDVLASVVRAEPDWHDLPPGTPSHLRRLLEKCLDKDRRQRLQAIGDARFDLEAQASIEKATDNARRRPMAAVIALALVPLAAVAGWWLGAGRSAKAPGVSSEPVRSVVPMPEGVRLAGWSAPALAISPDGRTIAYVGDGVDGKHLYVRSLDSFETVRVPDSEWAEGPFFSPDGAWVGFANGNISGNGSEPGRLRKYSVAEQTTRVICDVEDYFGGTWRDDGTIFWADFQPGSLRRVDADGGESQWVDLDASSRRAAFAWPQVLPSGTEALFTVWDGKDGGRAAIMDLETGELRDLGVDGHLARYLPTGHLIVARADRRLEGVRFDLESRQVMGAPVELLPRVSILGNDAGAFAVSDNGSLIYTTEPVTGSRHELAEIMLVRWDGTIERLPFEQDFYVAAATSPDGRRVAAATGSDGIFILDVERGTRFELPERDGVMGVLGPVWSPDGNEIVYSAKRGGDYSISVHAQRTDGEGLPELLHTRIGEFRPWSWVPGTRKVMVSGYGTGVNFKSAVFEIDLDQTDTLRPVKLSESDDWAPMVSPDGRWLAYTSTETGEAQVYVRSYPDVGPKIPIGVGRAGIWTPDMQQLYLFRAAGRRDGSLWAVDLDWSDPASPRPGIPRHVVDLEGQRGLLIDGPGRGLVARFQVEGSGVVSELNLVQNWFAEVQRLLPEK